MNRCLSGHKGLTIGVLCLGLLSGAPAMCADGGGHSGHSHLGLFVGAGEEEFGNFAFNA